MNLKTTAKSIIIACAMIITPFCSAFAEEETNEVEIITSDGKSSFGPWNGISNLNDNNCTIKLQKNIETSGSVTISKNCTIDLNGYTITIKDDNLIKIEDVEVTINGGGGIKRNEESDNYSIINIETSQDGIASSLIINGGEYSGTITNSNYGNLVINGGTFSNDSTIIDNTMVTSNVFIYGGTFDNSDDVNNTPLIKVSGGFVSIAGGNFTSIGNVVSISSGDAVSLGLYNGTFTSKNSSPINLGEGDATNLECAILGGTYTATATGDNNYVFPNYDDGGNSIVADGLSVYDEKGNVKGNIEKLTGGPYTVKLSALETDAVASLTIGEETTYYSSLPLAFTVAQGASEATITLCKNSYLEGEEYIHFETGNITFDLNGHTVSGSSEYLITVGGSDKPYLHPQLTIVDNGDGGSLNNNSEGESTMVAAHGATLTINGGTFKMINRDVSNYYIEAYNSTLTINEGTFDEGNNAIYVNGNSTLEINGGTFNNYIGAYYSTLTINGGAFNNYIEAYYDATLEINDGTFNNYIEAYNNSTLTINGGMFETSDNTVVIYDSEFNITGGEFLSKDSYCLNILGNLTGCITGGMFSSGDSYSIICIDPDPDPDPDMNILPEGYIFYDKGECKEIECGLSKGDGRQWILSLQDGGAAITSAKVKGKFDIENVDDLKRTFSTISENPQKYQDANINILEDIKLENNITIDNNNNVNLSEVPSYNLGSTEYPFQGTVKGNGHTIENLVVQTDSKSGIFGFTGDRFNIENLNLKAQAFINSISGNKDASTEPVEVPLFFGSNKGTVKGLSFVGQVYFDEALGDAELTWVGNNEEGASFSNSFVYFTEDGETKSATIGDNKVCVVLKQNMRVGKGKGRTYKVCSGPKSTKAAIEVNPDNPDDAEILSDTRECTAEQFANGEVAYWLNYDGKGYSNDYNKIWSQGNEYPVLATEKNKYLVKLLYVVNNGKYADSFAAPYFANVGTTVTISYTTQPESITVDGVEIFQSGNKARTRADVDHIGAFNFKVGYNKSVEMGASEQTFIVPETAEGKGIVTVNINFPAETAIAQHTDSEANVAVAGNRIVISNAVGQDIKLYDLAGHCLVSEQAPSEEVTIIVPEKGVYIVKAGNKTEKIIVR